MNVNKNKIFICIGFFSLILLLAVIVALSGDERLEAPCTFTVVAQAEKEEIQCWKDSDDRFVVFLPSYSDLSNTFIKLTTSGTVTLNGVELFDGMSCEEFCLGEEYTMCYTAWGISHQQTLTFMKSDNVATMYIDTESGSMAYIHQKKGNEEKGYLKVYQKDGTLNSSSALEQVKGRGNGTWVGIEKKPYSIKLEEEKNLLGMGVAREWILLANYYDVTNIKNKLAYDFADKIGLAYSPDSIWVDLYLNGKYVGLYLLCERNEIHPARVSISAENGFLVSLDMESRMIEKQTPYFRTDAKQALRVHNYQGDNLSSLQQLFQSAENAILSSDNIDPISGKSLEELIDIQSWTKRYLVEEVFANYDGCFLSQFYYGECLDSPIYAGPIWDQDMILGPKDNWQLCNPNTMVANRLLVRDGYSAPWFHELYQKNEFYESMVQMYSKEFVPLLHKLIDEDIQAYYEQIESATYIDSIRWPGRCTDIAEEVVNIRIYLSRRMEFLTRIWTNKEPFVAVCAKVPYANYGYIMLETGSCLNQLPTLSDNEGQTFEGWYYEDTDEPFDETKPIYEDTAVYAKWADRPSKRVKQIIKLLPLAVIGCMGVALLWMDLRRSWKGN